VTERSDGLVSHHARALRAAGLVVSRRDGKMVLYSLTTAGAALLEAVLPHGAVGGPVTTARPIPLRTGPPPISLEERHRLAARVRLLSWVSLGYMAAEGGIAILAGVLAGSIALIGFGLDSAIEGFASAIIVWRFTGHRIMNDAAETRAQKLVAVQFFILAPYVAVESVRALVAGEHAEVSWLGIALSASSLVVMPYLGITRVASPTDSARRKRRARAGRTCCARTSLGPFSSAYSRTPPSARGGSTR
jgi:DNA-binding MarR family transcriptional regulator